MHINLLANNELYSKKKKGEGKVIPWAITRSAIQRNSWEAFDNWHSISFKINKTTYALVNALNYTLVIDYAPIHC